MKTFRAITVPVLIVMLQSCDWSMARPYGSYGALAGISNAVETILEGISGALGNQVLDVLGGLSNILGAAKPATLGVEDGFDYLVQSIFGGYSSSEESGGEYSSGEEYSSSGSGDDDMGDDDYTGDDSDDGGSGYGGMS